MIFLMQLFCVLCMFYTQHVQPIQDTQSEKHEMHAIPSIGHRDHAIGPAHEIMHGMYGNYPMTREASGTSWVPDSSPQEGFYIMYKDWMFMVNGFSYLVFDQQRGPLGNKGKDQVFSSNMFMFMAQKDLCDRATFGLRTMFSLEPLTIKKCGYPLLLQTGETCDGKTLLINKQHPHDLFMELAIVGTYKLDECSSAFLYAALPGEPALGPPVFMMRFASEYIPAAPIGHHWIDATHVTFGVITAGLVHKGFKFEVSGFKGREPDQHRLNIEMPQLDSFSCRISCNPSDNFALQASIGFLKSPEQLTPSENIVRTTLSALYNKSFGQDNNSNFQIAAIVGVNKEEPGKTSPAFLLDGTVKFCEKHVLFSRFESVKKDDLFIEPDPLADQPFTVKKITCGYVYEPIVTHHMKWGIGGLISFSLLPKPVAMRYGDDTSYMLFLQVRLV